MIAWFTGWWNEVMNWISGLWSDLVEFLTDLPMIVLQGVLDAIATVIESIPVPEFLQTGGLFAVVGALPDSIQYLLMMSYFAQALSIVGLGFTFRMTRKLVTLFQW